MTDSPTSGPGDGGSAPRPSAPPVTPPPRIRPSLRHPPAAAAPETAPAAEAPPSPPRPVRCYACGAEFSVPGGVDRAECPKCRTKLGLADHTVDGECRESLRTLGTIRVTREGVVQSTRLMATDIDLAGKVVNSSLQALRRLVLRAGADFMTGEVHAVDLCVEADADMRVRGELLFREVDVRGTIDAALFASGTVTVRPGGCVKGALYASRLAVEDGGDVLARLTIGPDSWSPIEKKMKEKFSRTGGSADSEHVVVKPRAAPPKPPPGG